MGVIQIKQRSVVECSPQSFAVGGKIGSCLLIEPKKSSKKWGEIQNNSMEDYEKTHGKENIDPSIYAYYRLFRGYAAASAHKALSRVLDVGCGISIDFPVYARNMSRHWDYCGLDPFQINLERKYPFLCSTLEAAAENLDFTDKFDLFLFCTSLDHFENTKECAEAVRSLAAPEARCVFWVGLHDPDLVAAPEGGAVFRRLFRSHPAFAPLMYFGYGILRFPKTVYNMWRRRRMLASGKPLDNLHFWYFTRDNIEGHLRSFGEIEDVLYIPGCNYVFATCKVSAPNA